jgi:hypothetical protein
MVIMNAINTVASLLNQGIDAVTEYIKENGIHIAAIVLVIYFFRKYCK